MERTREWYLAWTPGARGYSRDDVILAVGVQCGVAPIPLHNVIDWLGFPDKVRGSRDRGEIVYLFKQDDQAAAHFMVIGEQVQDFGTIARQKNNSKKVDPDSGKEVAFNVLDEMVPFADSEMAAGWHDRGV